MRFIGILFIAVLTLISCSSENDCAPSGNFGFVCGVQNAEDLVRIPETQWIIASSSAPGGTLHLIDAETKTLRALYPAEGAGEEHDSGRYASCPGAPDLGNFVSHGLSIRAVSQDRATLYAVTHGAREAIDVFDVSLLDERPELTWIGCVPMPEGLAANSVSSFRDGSIVATVVLHPGMTFGDMFRGGPTGGVYRWSPGDEGFSLMRGTELPGNNGIEVSPDETEIYVASTGLSTVVAFSATNPAEQLRTTERLTFLPDNLHLAGDGRVIAAGAVSNEPGCMSAADPDNFDRDEYVSCPRRSIGILIDPRTMRHTELASEPANDSFTMATTALQVGEEVWFGTVVGDRVAYRPAGEE